MIDQLKRMAIFAAVVEAGSLTAAARRLGMTTSAVSQNLNLLEQELGIHLLHRSSRRQTLTPAGELFLEGCQRMVATAQEYKLLLTEIREEPVGELRIAAPIGLSPVLAKALTPLLTAYPRLSLTLFAEDTRIDFQGRAIDVAFRFGRREDSQLISRKLLDLEGCLCASPSYLATHPPICTAEDLLQHEWLTFIPHAQFGVELINPAGELISIRPVGRIALSAMRSVIDMCVAGAGVGRFLVQDANDELQAGRLVRLLPGWKLPRPSLYAITARRDALPAKVHMAIQAVRDYYRAVQSAEDAAPHSALETTTFWDREVLSEDPEPRLSDPLPLAEL